VTLDAQTIRRMQIRTMLGGLDEPRRHHPEPYLRAVAAPDHVRRYERMREAPLGHICREMADYIRAEVSRAARIVLGHEEHLRWLAKRAAQRSVDAPKDDQ